MYNKSTNQPKEISENSEKSEGRLLSTGVMSTKSYQQSTSKHGKNSFSVLPDIVANYKTTMCNPYEKRKVTTNRSKIPVPKISTNGKSRGVVPAPVKAAKQVPLSKSTGLPAGFFGPAKTELATFKIPKLKRSGCDTMNYSSSTKCPKNMSRMTDRSSRKPTTYVLKVSQSSKQGPHTTTTVTTTNPKRSVLKTAKIAATTTVTVNRPQQVQQGPWPCGIPPCSRYTVKWGDPAYTGSYVEGEWCYDVVGAAPRLMGWPDMSDMFPDIPKGIFELRSVEPCAVPSELSSAEGRPGGSTESQEAHHVSDTNNGQSSKPASRDAVCDNTSSVASITGPSVTMCAEFQGREVSLVAPPCYTNVSAVTQTTTVCDQAKVTSFHSDGTSVHSKRDSHVKSVSKAREIKRCDNGPYDINLYKLFSSYPSTDVHKRGIKRSADDCVEPLFFKKIKTERQD